jgi:hypothetical protein
VEKSLRACMHIHMHMFATQQFQFLPVLCRLIDSEAPYYSGKWVSLLCFTINEMSPFYRHQDVLVAHTRRYTSSHPPAAATCGIEEPGCPACVLRTSVHTLARSIYLSCDSSGPCRCMCHRRFRDVPYVLNMSRWSNGRRKRRWRNSLTW